METGVAHKSIRMIQNLNTQITLKGEKNGAPGILTEYTPVSFASPGLKCLSKMNLKIEESRKSILKN